MKKIQPRPRHPDIDKIWDKYKRLIYWWAALLVRNIGGEEDSYVAELFLKCNNDLWLFDKNRGVPFSTYFTTNLFDYFYRTNRINSDMEMATYYANTTTIKNKFNPEVFHQQTCDIDQKYYLKLKDNHNWACDIIAEIGGNKEIWRVLTFNMKERPVEVLYRHFVLGEKLAQIGRYFNLSRERVRQIKVVALSWIRRKFIINKKLNSFVKEHGLTMKNIASPLCQG